MVVVVVLASDYGYGRCLWLWLVIMAIKGDFVVVAIDGYHKPLASALALGRHYSFIGSDLTFYHLKCHIHLSVIFVITMV